MTELETIGMLVRLEQQCNAHGFSLTMHRDCVEDITQTWCLAVFEDARSDARCVARSEGETLGGALRALLMLLKSGAKSRAIE